MPSALENSEAPSIHDLVIAFMGPAGSGKSFLIDLMMGQKGMRANNTLRSPMTRVEHSVFEHEKYPRRRIVLVDTPGFDEEEVTDVQKSVHMTKDWLNNRYKTGMKLSGIVLTHPITDNRVSSSRLRSWTVFRDLFERDTLENVVLLTTMWQELERSNMGHIGEVREAELRQMWSGMISKGARMKRLEQATFEDAWRIVDDLIQGSVMHERAAEAQAEEEPKPSLMKRVRQLLCC